MAYEDDDTGRQRWMLQPIGQSVSKLPCKWPVAITLLIFIHHVVYSEAICQ